MLTLIFQLMRTVCVSLKVSILINWLINPIQGYSCNFDGNHDFKLFINDIFIWTNDLCLKHNVDY